MAKNVKFTDKIRKRGLEAREPEEKARDEKARDEKAPEEKTQEEKTPPEKEKTPPEEPITAQEIWRRYQAGLDFLRQTDLAGRTEKAHRFFLGDQWYGVQGGGDAFPVFNFIKPVVKYKVATVAQNTMSAVYAPLEGRDPEFLAACELLNQYFAKKWERAKLDSLSWKLIKDACIQGDAYLYFGEGDDVTAAQLLDNVNLFLADESDPDIQAQKYIIIRERRFVEDVCREAAENGLPADQIAEILPDSGLGELSTGQAREQSWAGAPAGGACAGGGSAAAGGSCAGSRGKCTSLLYLYKDQDGVVHWAKAVKNLVYQPDSPIRATDPEGNPMDLGLRSYPLVNFLWEDKKGSARGSGEVEFLIPNQLEVNKTLARRAIAVKQSAFPKLAYAQNAVLNPGDLDLVGGKIAVKNMGAQSINAMVGYLNPAMLSPDAKNLSDELIYQSRELAGAGDAATGSIDPTQASGTAIIAVRDQTALPLNEQLSRYRQFVEDLAYLWYDLWAAYNPNGIDVETEAPEGGAPEVKTIPREVLEQMKVNVRVDVSQNNPFSKFAQEQSLERLFQMQAISFEEYVAALGDDAAVPKGKLTDILARRQAEQARAQAAQEKAAQTKEAQVRGEQVQAGPRQDRTDPRQAQADPRQADPRQAQGEQAPAGNQARQLAAQNQQLAAQYQQAAAQNRQLQQLVEQLSRQVEQSTAALSGGAPQGGMPQGGTVPGGML